MQHKHTKILDQSVIDILKKYFIFDRIFDLIDYDLNMDQLYNELKVLKKDKFEHNYRFVFLHYDTEYYITQNLPGITLINLQKILESLDIPNYFCLLLSQQDLQPMCNRVWKDFASNDSCSIANIHNFLHNPIHPYIKDSNLESNETLITKKYISLNGVGRFHRRILISLLKSKNLLESGIVSYLGK
jgi:hypothetical protein